MSSDIAGWLRHEASKETGQTERYRKLMEAANRIEIMEKLIARLATLGLDQLRL